MQFYSKVAGLYVSCNLTEYWLIFNYFAITDFAKIISSLSESKTNQFQGTPLNGGSETIHLLELSKDENDCKTFQ